jgi:hypothetical protein
MQAGSGIAEIVALEISRHEKKSVDENLSLGLKGNCCHISTITFLS